MLLPDGSIAANRSTYVSRWDGVSWTTIAGALPEGTIRRLGLMGDGRLIAASTIINTFTVYTSKLYVLSDGTWTQLGPTLTGSYPQVEVIKPYGEGVLLGVYERGVVRWTGSAWQSMGGPGGGQDEVVLDLAVLPNNDIIALGGFYSPPAPLYRWNGSVWASLGAVSGGSVETIVAHPNGNLYVGGSFGSIAGVLFSKVAGWNTSTGWFGLGSGMAPPGQFASAVWNLGVSPNGDVIATGEFTHAGGIPANNHARWNGTNWAAMPPGADAYHYSSLVMHPSGEMIVGGAFQTRGGVLTPNFARYTFTHVPWVARNPWAFRTPLGVNLSAAAAVGYDGLNFRWQRESAVGSGVWIDVANGPGGASPGGGVVSNASGVVNGGLSATMTIFGMTSGDEGAFRCLFANACGEAASAGFALSSSSVPCPADLTSTALPGQPGYGVPNGLVNSDDFFYYISLYVSALGCGSTGIPACASPPDLTSTVLIGAPGYGTPDNMLNSDDFFYYLAFYASGC